MSEREIAVTLTEDQVRALLEGWEIEETMPTKAFGVEAANMERAEDALLAAKHRLRQALAFGDDTSTTGTR